MVEIDKDMALALQLHSMQEVYFIDDDGQEFLIEDSQEIIDNQGYRYGIEGKILEIYKEG